MNGKANMKPASDAAGFDNHAVIGRQEWLARRLALMEREKELTHLRDAVARERRELPWERLDKDYVFDSVKGPCSLAELFRGRSQLIVQHFMLGPGWDEGCPSCSFMADHVGPMLLHLAHRDVAFVAVSRAPMAEIERFRQRMGWQFEWVSSNGTDFNFDFAVSFTPEALATGKVFYNYHETSFPGSEAPGISVFAKGADGQVFHSYSTFGRGVEVMMGTYDMLDLVPRGRDEEDVPYKMNWVRHHDRYEPLPEPLAGTSGSCCAGRA